MGGGAEFAPGFAENIDEFFARVVGVLGGEGADFVFEKDEHGGVFEGLGAGVGFEAGFRNPGGDLGGVGGRHPGGEEEGAGAVGLFYVEGAAPGEVADFACGKGRAGGEPAFEVLAAGGEAQEGRSVGHEARDPGLDTVGVDQLGGAAVGRPRGVGGVGGVDQLAGSGVGVHTRRGSGNGWVRCGKPRVGVHANGSRVERGGRIFSGAMNQLTLTQLVPILQLAIGPVILISGVGLLLLTLTNRFGRMLDRSRAIIHEVLKGGQAPAVVGNLQAQVEILHRRARILRLSITLAAVTVLGVGVLILGLFIAAFWQVPIGGALVVIFCVAILGLIGSMVAFISDMNLALRAAQLDWKLIEKRVEG